MLLHKPSLTNLVALQPVCQEPSQKMLTKIGMQNALKEMMSFKYYPKVAVAKLEAHHNFPPAGTESRCCPVEEIWGKNNTVE